MDTYIEKEQAKNPDTSSDTLEQVAKDRKNDVRMAVAYNSFASPKVLAQLATEAIHTGLGITI